MGLREDLLRPEAYPAPSTASVELRETHASWVYLTEGDVYKVKRPVDLGFLDFHTVELRRAACEAELMLNRRLAASVYLGVVPVRLGPDGRHHFGPEGEVVDWAVHMLRLDDHRTADALLAARALTERHVDRLAAHLAAFHGRCRADEATRAFGSPAAVRAHVVQNFEKPGRSSVQHGLHDLPTDTPAPPFPWKDSRARAYHARECVSPRLRWR